MNSNAANERVHLHVCARKERKYVVREETLLRRFLLAAIEAIYRLPVTTCHDQIGMNTHFMFTSSQDELTDDIINKKDRFLKIYSCIYNRKSSKKNRERAAKNYELSIGV